MLIGAFTWVKRKKQYALRKEERTRSSFKLEGRSSTTRTRSTTVEVANVAEHVEEEAKEEITEEEKKSMEDFDVEVFRLAIALPSRAAEVVLEGIIQMYLQLRTDGCQVRQLHPDRAREFTTRTLQRWCLNRGIYRTTTAGDSPQ